MAYKVTLDDKQKEVIKEKLSGHDLHPIIPRRLNTLLLLDAGVTRQKIAKGLNVSPAIITRWVKIYLEQGLEALCAHQLFGKRSSVLDPYQDQIIKLAADHNYSAMKDLNKELRVKFNVNVHFNWLYRYCKKNSASLTKRPA